MIKDLVSRYIWLIDTINRHKGITREEINSLWMQEPMSGGEPLAPRTFYHYRRNIEDNFNIKINCDGKGRYCIDGKSAENARVIANLVVESFVISNAVKESHLPEGSVEIEDIPSSGEHFPVLLDAIKNSKKVVFRYSGFMRSRSQSNLLFSPYVLKRYRQRWYVTGLLESKKSIRTYALDRISRLRITGEEFKKPEDFDPDKLFADIVGVTTSEASVKTVKLRVTPIQAKYFRGLPLHKSQSEEKFPQYSIFSYRLKLNYELVHEILSLGDSVKVLEPPELVAMIVTELKNTIQQYES